MHQISINVGNVVWALLFKTEARAVDAWQSYKDRDTLPMLEIQDDFGQVFAGRPSQIHGAVFEDLSLSKNAAVERSLHHARTQNEAQIQAENDQVLRAQRRGPAIVSPFQGGFNGGRG